MHENDLALPATIFGAEAASDQTIPSASPSGWPGKNARRLELIDKTVGKGLTAAETEELRELQKECDRFLEVLQPLPFDVLEQVKACARREGLIPPSTPQE